MSDGMGREPTYLSSHATNRYFIPNWGRNVSESIQKLITDTLAFDKNVKLNSLFYKGDEERVTVCCNMETLGEHKALLDLLVSRLRSRSEVYSAGWEKKEPPQEDF